MTTGLCECGCGKATTVAKRTNHRFGHVAGQHQRFLLGHKGASREPRRVVDANGYVRINGKFEHRVVAEMVLGKRLPKRAQVHHIDGDRTNNTPRNLVICESAAYHNLLHQRLRALEACGDATARRCVLCAAYNNQEDITINSQGVGLHRACRLAYNQQYVAPRKARYAEHARKYRARKKSVAPTQ